MTGCDIDDALQRVAAGLPMALDQRREKAEPVVVSVVNRLTMRRSEGDDVVAQDLIARLQGKPLDGTTLPVDLEMLCDVMEGDETGASGGYLDLHTGEVCDDVLTDEAMVGDSAIDVDEDPDRWLWVECTGSREGWDDMAAFAARQRDPQLRERLEQAIEGRGAFRRFRDLVHREDVSAQWRVFSDDRRLGRARGLLAREGIRVA